MALGFEYLDNYLKLRKATEKKLSLDQFQEKFNRCNDIIDQLYAMNKDYILHDVALDYLNRGLGRITTTAYAGDLGLVSSWMIIGPFDNSGDKTHDTVYPPEKEIDFAKSYTGKNGKKIQWKEHHNPEYLGKIDLVSIFNDVGNVSAYAAVTVNSPEQKEVQFRIGSNDLVKVWLNGKEIWNWNDPSGRLVTLDDDIVNVTLPKGESQILLKVSNLGGNWGFCFRITDDKGNKIQGLHYKLR